MNSIYTWFLGVGEAVYQTLVYDNRYKFILEGLFNTLIIAIFSVIIGILIGIVVALIRNNYDRNNKMKVLNFIAKSYVDIIRGTPVILQLMIIYYVIFKSAAIPVVLVGILAFGINSGAYVSEIIRAGIQSIPIGQMEAGYALGLKYNQIMRHIILPQAIRNILPALGNEFITLVKETSVGAYIGIIELTKMDNEDDELKKCKTYIKEHLHENITIEMLAQHLNLSTRYFRKLFTENSSPAV